MVFNVGDRIRSFDFANAPGGRDLEGPRACYVEGLVAEFVTGEGTLRYRVLVDREVFGGKECTVRVDRYAHPPVNGLPCAGDTEGVTFPNFVELI